jgi:hypothetical protein
MILGCVVVNWIELADYRIQRRCFVNTELNFQIHKIRELFDDVNNNKDLY